MSFKSKYLRGSLGLGQFPDNLTQNITSSNPYNNHTHTQHHKFTDEPTSCVNHVTGSTVNHAHDITNKCLKHTPENVMNNHDILNNQITNSKCLPTIQESKDHQIHNNPTHIALQIPNTNVKRSRVETSPLECERHTVSPVHHHTVSPGHHHVVCERHTVSPGHHHAVCERHTVSPGHHHTVSSAHPVLPAIGQRRVPHTRPHHTSSSVGNPLLREIYFSQNKKDGKVTAHGTKVGMTINVTETDAFTTPDTTVGVVRSSVTHTQTGDSQRAGDSVNPLETITSHINEGETVDQNKKPGEEAHISHSNDEETDEGHKDNEDTHDEHKQINDEPCHNQKEESNPSNKSKVDTSDLRVFEEPTNTVKTAEEAKATETAGTVQRHTLSSVKRGMFNPLLPTIRRMCMDDDLDKPAAAHCRTSTTRSVEDFTWADTHGGCLLSKSDPKTKVTFDENNKYKTDENTNKVQVEKQNDIFSKFLSNPKQSKEDDPQGKLLEKLKSSDDYHFDGYLLKVIPHTPRHNAKITRPGPTAPLPYGVASQFRPGV